MSAGANMPVMSFVVNAFNTERFIGSCLRSILAQEDPPSFEVIVVDDCSTDGTEAEVRSFADPRIIYLRNEVNLNAAAAVNIAFANARGRFIARIDSDDEYRPQFVKRTLPLLREHANVGLVYGDVEFMNEDGRLQGAWGRVGERRGGRPPISRELIPLLFENYIPAATMIARREAWDCALPVPNGRNFCDWFWSLNMARKWDFAFVDEVLSNYRLHPGNMHKAMVREKYGETITWLNLEEIFAQEDFGPDAARLKKEVYATHAAALGQKYFGMEMPSDARRCLMQALKLKPCWMIRRPELARWWVASFLPRGVWNRAKRLVK
jgi:glycosyltransferase involved in cell wall biosynthesis